MTLYYDIRNRIYIVYYGILYMDNIPIPPYNTTDSTEFWRLRDIKNKMNGKTHAKLIIQAQMKKLRKTMYKK